MPESINIPTLHREALDWCRRQHPRLDPPVPEADCPGELDRVQSITPRQVGISEYGCEVAILRCRECSAELAIGRGTDEMAAALAPGLHGRLLWIDADGRFEYLDREFNPDDKPETEQ